MSAVGRGRSRHPRGRAVCVVLATLGLFAVMAVSSPALGRADTSYPVLLVHGGLGNATNFNEMARRLKDDGYRFFTVNLPFPAWIPSRNAEIIRDEVGRIRAGWICRSPLQPQSTRCCQNALTDDNRAVTVISHRQRCTDTA